MKKADLITLRLFIYGLPFVVLLAFFTSSYDSVFLISAANYIKQLYNFAGLVFAMWILLAIYLGFRLMISGTFREKVLSKLTFIKERDEREAMLTGRAAKATMLTTIAILLCLFCLSCFQVSIYTVPPEAAIDGKLNVISLGFNFDLLASSSRSATTDVIKKSILDYAGLPISSSAIILGLIIWQVIAYNYSMRRFMK